MSEAKRDNNQVTTMIGVSSADGVTPVVIWVDPVTHRLLVDLSGSYVFNEVMGGTVNGINKDFTLANIPKAGTQRIYLEGQRLTPTIDYTISGLTVTLNSAPTGNPPIADYNI